MLVTQKCQYALRALFDLARLEGQGPIKIVDIAQRQAIPPRFLENIMNQLKQGGFVESRRGKEGGFLLARPAKLLAVGEVIRFLQGPILPIADKTGGRKGPSSAHPGDSDFAPMWEKAEKALNEVYDSITLGQLLEEAQRREQENIPMFVI
ncbi:MAG: Rrf2 family transcriptional regulator [Candidatus Sumerlaeota bacterium]|nr:Rrf2 family transcriptional regulator [Candidatus Sumerlaeota bacterium]